MIKLIVSDMDGTLLSENLDISIENSRAIHQAQEAGIHFMIATGRTHHSGYNIAKEAGIRCPFIALNGAEFYDEHENLKYTRHIEKDMMLSLAHFLNDKGAHTELITPQATYTKRSPEDYIEALMEELSLINEGFDRQEALRYFERHRDSLHLKHVNHYEHLLNKSGEPILKVLVNSRDQEELKEIKAKVEAEFPDLIVTSASPRNLEINTKQANKGYAVAEYAKSLGLSADEVATVGDNLNDKTMLSWAKYGFAVENAIPAAKEAANYQTVHHRDHVIADIVSRIFAGEFN